MYHRSLAIRLTAIIVILAATATSVAAQRGGFRGGVSTFRGGPAVRTAPGAAFIGRPVAPFVRSPVTPFVRPPVVAGPFRTGPIGRVGSFGVRHFPRTIIVPPVVGFGYYSPYVWPSTAYEAPPYYSPYDSTYAAPAAAAPAVSQGEVDLAYQVGRLSEEIQQLRQQQALTPQQTLTPQQPQGQSQSVPGVPTVLVFRDGHRLELQNYAVIGQTLWVLDERNATKISISDLDLDATQKENRSRGLRFPLSEK